MRKVIAWPITMALFFVGALVGALFGNGNVHSWIVNKFYLVKDWANLELPWK